MPIVLESCIVINCNHWEDHCCVLDDPKACAEFFVNEIAFLHDNTLNWNNGFHWKWRRLKDLSIMFTFTYLHPVGEWSIYYLFNESHDFEHYLLTYCIIAYILHTFVITFISLMILSITCLHIAYFHESTTCLHMAY